MKRGAIGICVDKNKRGFGRLIERGIEGITGGQGYHVFLMLNEETGIEAHAGKGVYTFNISKYIKGNEVVKFFFPPLTDHQIDLVCQKALSYEGEKYSIAQIFGFALVGKGAGNNNKTKVCSTLLGNAFYEVGIQFRGLRPDEVTPYDINRHCKHFGWESDYLYLR